MKKILVVEDSSTVTRALRRIIELESDFMGCYAASYAQTVERVTEERDDIFAALVDLHLPDAVNGEVVDYLLALGIPVIVLSAQFEDESRARLLKKGIVDYVGKEGLYSFRYAVKLVGRIYKNQSIKVLVVDDSEVSRRYISQLLTLYLFQTCTAVDGVDATEKILADPEIKLLITDYNMPNMDGYRLIQNLRNKHKKSDLAIIGLSSDNNESLSARFIKHGANDFLRKPFNHEEFQCRVLHNIEALEHIAHIRNVANRDYLTGAYNRRYFFSVGGNSYHSAVKENTSLAVAVIDIDFFKKINDSHGHSIGDGVLKYFAKTLSSNLNRFLVARAGGEEFFILMPGLSNSQASILIDRTREIICASPVDVDGTLVKLAFSAGVSNKTGSSLDEQIQIADEYLYTAKNNGRNCVIDDTGTVFQQAESASV